MLVLCLCALAGAYTLQLCDQLPGKPLLAVLAIISLGAFFLRRTRIAGAYLSGLVLLAYCAHGVIDDRLSPAIAGTTISFVARIADFPKDNGAALSFPAEPLGRDDLPGRVRLSWFDASSRPRVGETWRFDARLRRPRGFSNPGGFDYEAWLFRQSIGATGYVVEGANNLRQSEAADGISRLRQRFVDRVGARLPGDDASAVVMAVAVGARHAITREQWSRYAATGTSHLMAISGLHIGLAAGGVFLLSRCLLSCFCRRGNIRDRAAVIAMIAAYSYAEISGFAVPAKRALLMTIVIVLAGLMRRRISAPRLLAACCLVILVTDPLAILAPGFKLSFAAVAILFWHLRVRRIPDRCAGNRVTVAIRKVIRTLSTTQLALLFGLMPLTALLFNRVAVLAPLVNLLALPVFNFLTIPACLVALALDGPFEPAGNLALDIAYRSVTLVLWLVREVAELPLTSFQIAEFRGLSVIAVFLPALMCVLPPGWPGRNLAIVAALATILYRPPGPPEDCVDLHVLDVGQGLASVMQTEHHAAVYDTGPSFRGGADTGQLVLVPFLRAQGIDSVDLLIVSHADQDHAGGARSLIGAMTVSRLLTGETLEDVGPPQGRCLSGETWRWDGVGFAIIHPAEAGRWQGNNASCVLEIHAARHRVILSGDIESPVENMLAASGAVQPAEIVLVPHHGSRTSSSRRFVGRAAPRVAIVSTGHGNRWGFPKRDVVELWRHAGAEVLNTATSGAISYRICRDTGVTRLAEHRPENRRYWHDLPEE